MIVVADGVLVDVDTCAKDDTHTGIHRVVRETVPRWRRDHDVTVAAWAESSTGLRPLTPVEEARVFRFGEHRHVTDGTSAPSRLLVPWRSVVVLPDVPKAGMSTALACLARSSGNAVALIGYDMIPVVSAETRPALDAVSFSDFLLVVKHSHRVAGISTSARSEFAGFAAALRAQGLRGPDVTEVLLAEEAPAGIGSPGRKQSRGRPVVVALGSREPHKNQRAVVHAAELLWREGLDFELRLVGGPGWSDAVLRPAMTKLIDAGRPLADVGRVSEARLWQEIRDADFTVFVSLHEGYGLPVAESLACGTPVITSAYGSQAEIAADGGCLTVDPRDDHAIASAMRALLGEPERLARLADEVRRRPGKTWDAYAADLWDALVAPGAPRTEEDER